MKRLICILTLLWVLVFAGCSEKIALRGSNAPETIRNDDKEAFAWGHMRSGIRLGILVKQIHPAELNLFTFITAAENCTDMPVKIAFGDYGACPQHPVYPIVNSKGVETGCIIPHRAYALKDPYSPQPAFPMTLKPMKVTILYTTTFVPPLSPGKYRIFARVSTHIPAVPAFVNDAYRMSVVEETKKTLGAFRSGSITLTIRDINRNPPSSVVSKNRK